MVFQIIVKHCFAAKNAGVLGVEAENQADAQHIQAFQRFRAFRVCVFGEQSVVESAHQFAGLERNLHFFLDMRFLFVYQKFQPVVFFGQVGEQKAFRVVIGLLHIVNVEFFKIADDNPAGTLGIRQIGGVSLRLLKWRQQRPVGLPYGLL